MNITDLPAHVGDKIAPEPNTGCWHWQAAMFRGGYGLAWRNGKNRLAHREVYEHLIGQIPEGLTLDHLCRVRSCVNPDHLEPVSFRENVLRGVGITARRARQTHCRRGHELSGSNLRVETNGARRCMTCDNERCRRRHSMGYVPPCRRNGMRRRGLTKTLPQVQNTRRVLPAAEIGKD